MLRKVQAGGILLTLALTPTFGQHTVFLEAEDFEGLRYFSFHNLRAEGWYAREANCRSYGTIWGQGKVAAIHATGRTRAMSLRLDAPLPPGSYKLSVRVVGTTMAEKLERDNVLEVKLGEAAIELRWRTVGKRFKWLPLQSLELTRPAATVRVVAAQFGGAGVTHLNEAQAPSIWLDTLYVTSDMSQAEPPSPELERKVKFGLDTLPTPAASRPLMHERFDPPQPFEPQAIELTSCDGRRNLFPNGSFELGMNNGWAATNKAYTYCYLFTDEDLDDRDPVHGRYSLRVPPGASPFSRPCRLAEGGALTLSVSMRSDQPQKARLRLLDAKVQKGDNTVLSTDCEVTDEWQRFSVSGEVSAGWLYVGLQNTEALWVDGLQLERGELSPFEPRAEVEAGVSTGAIGNVFPEGRADLRLWLHNSANSPREARVRYRALDLWERVVVEETTPPLVVAANSTVWKPMPLSFTTRGIFSLQCAVDDRPLPEGELAFVVLPPAPEGEPRHHLAANMDVLEPPYRLMSRMGFTWQLYCKFYPTLPNRAQPEAGNWVWFDEETSLASKHGMETLPCLWPSRPQPFWGDPSKIPGETLGVCRNAQRNYGGRPAVYPDLAGWREFVHGVTEHYGASLKTWCIEDETELYFTPREFAPIVEATHDATRSVAPALRIGTSMCPQYHEELLHLVGDKLDFLAASSFGAQYWEARKIRHLQQRTGKPWYCIGVGLSNQPTFHHTLPHARSALRDAAMTAQELVKLCVVQDAKVIGHYTGRIWNDGRHLPRDVPLVDYDGTPLPHGAMYASVGRLLANAVPRGEARLGGESGCTVFLFEQDGRTHAVTWLGAPAGLYGHNVHTAATAWSRPRQVSLAAPDGSIRLTDPFGNALNAANPEGEALSAPLTPMPVLIWNEGLAAGRFVDVLRGAKLSTPQASGRLRLVGSPSSLTSLDLLVEARWLGPDGRKPDTVEVGTAPGQLMTDNQWVLTDRRRALVSPTDWQANEFSVRVPTVLTPALLRHPLENAQLYAWLLREAKPIHGLLDTLWLVAAPEVESVKLDGDLSEWERRSAAWIDYSFSWARFGRWLEQVDAGGEHLEERLSDTDYLDARVAFWCGWTERDFYLAARVFDDQPQQGDTLEVSFGGGIPAAVAQTAIPMSEGKGQVGAVSFFTRSAPDGWRVELRTPLRSAAPEPTPLRSLDLRYTDVDTVSGRPTTAVLRWAGASTGGQVWLLPKAPSPIAGPQSEGGKPMTATKPWQQHGPLRVSDNGRFLQHTDGTPFFWLGDTTWALHQNLSREEVSGYLDDSAAIGFTVIQLMSVNNWALKDWRNFFGDKPYLDDTAWKLNMPYWQHVGWVIDEAGKRGQYAMLVYGSPGRLDGHGPVTRTPSEAYAYGHALGAFFKDKPNLLWSGGIDLNPDDPKRASPMGLAGWDAMAEGITDGVCGIEQFDGKADWSKTLFTYHPRGFSTSSTWFHSAPWLDFNGAQVGWKGDSLIRMIHSDYVRKPTKPIINLEPWYEEVTWKKPPVDDWGVRVQAYQTFFAGAAGHTYGHIHIYQFDSPGEPGGFKWRERLQAPGRLQMKHLRKLMLSQPLAGRAPLPELVVAATGDAQRSLQLTERVSALGAADGSWAFVYSPTGAAFTVDLTKLRGPQIATRWFDPRTGELSEAGEYAIRGQRRFDPPGPEGRGHDAVLVVAAP